MLNSLPLWFTLILMNQPDVQNAQHVIVLGAGLSGLWAAGSLLKSNPTLKITILERNPEPGGLFKSSNRCGFHFNHGLFLFPGNSPLIAMQPHRFRPVAVVYNKVIDGRLSQFPVDPFEMRSISRPSQIPVIIRHMARRLMLTVRGTEPANLDEWLRLNMPDRWSRIFRIDDYVFKLMGYEPQDLSSEVGRQRLGFIVRMFQPQNLIWHLIRKIRMTCFPAPSGQPPPAVGHYELNEEGTNGFIRELADRIRKMGCRIVPDAHILAIESNPSGFKIRLQDRESLNCRVIVSTIPVTELARYRAVSPISAERLKWRHVGLFFFRLKLAMQEQPMRVIYSFDRNCCWKRAVLQKIDNVYTGVCVEITSVGFIGDHREEFAGRIRADLSRILGFNAPEVWEQMEYLDTPYGYPCLLQGYQQNLKDLAEKILEPGLYSFSRQGSHRYANSADCVAMVESEIAGIVSRHHLN